MPVGGVTCPLLRAAALGAAQPCGVSLTTGGIAPVSLRYDRLTPVARVAGPPCLAGDPLLGCVPARLSPAVAMAPGDVCHGPRRSPAGLGRVALEYRSCYWPGGSAVSPQCVRLLGCGLLRPVPLLPSVRVRVRCPGPLGACSPVRGPCVPCAVSVATCRLFTGARAACGMRVLLVASLGSPPSFLCLCFCGFFCLMPWSFCLMPSFFCCCFLFPA